MSAHISNADTWTVGTFIKRKMSDNIRKTGEELTC